MRAIAKATWRVLPPLLVALLYVDLFTSPFVARMGISNTGAQDPRALPPNEVKRLVAMSDMNFHRGDYQLALEPALRLYHSYPEDAVYLQRLADIYHGLGQYDKEATIWEQFLQHAPLPTEGCPQIGKAYEKQKKWKEAIYAYERCLAFDTTDPDSLFALARALELERQLERADTLYQQCIAISSKDSDCQLGEARVLLRKGNRAEARKIAEAVLARSPDNTDALLVMSLVLWREGDLAGARKVLEHAVKLSAQYTELYVALGRVAEKQGDTQTAGASYEHALELDPESHEIPHRWLAPVRRP